MVQKKEKEKPAPTEAKRRLGKMVKLWYSLLLAFLLVTNQAHGQPSVQGFISIDCGLADSPGYNDITNIWYNSDSQYVDSGNNSNIAASYITSGLPKQDWTVRSFPNGARNCYTLKPVVAGNKYLLRATFMYGNYDGLQNAQPSKPLLFDLYLGANSWRRVNITDASTEYRFEVINVALADFIWVCLANIGSGTPFISALELRPLDKDNNLYPYAFANQSNSFLYLLNYGPTTNQRIRYPDDPYDRIWVPYPYSSSVWTELITTANIQRVPGDVFQAPLSVLQTAVTPLKFTSLDFLQWLPESNAPAPPEYYTVFHIAELARLSGNASRQFNLSINYRNDFSYYSPDYLQDTYIYSFASTIADGYVYSFNATGNATLPPLINAAQVYSLLHIKTPMADAGEVEAITSIRAQYGVKRNWMGDPCSPKKYVWDGLNCSYTGNTPRIIFLNLSSYNLTGTISNSFSAFETISYLDLSYNNLSGSIPDFLGRLQSLLVLNLAGNHFTGPVPDALIKKANAGLLVLRVDCMDSTSCTTPPAPTKKRNTTPIIIGVSVAAAVLLAAVILAFCLIARTRVTRHSPPLAPSHRDSTIEKIQPRPPVRIEPRPFTYMQLKNITDNFTQVIGRGGFGAVYHGHLEDGNEVAVKVCSQASFHGTKQFLTEAKSLSQVHHKNLVSLVGYCNDGDSLALVYEYMAQGSLHDHLRGKRGIARVLNWELRLQITFDAAQGLDYLHTGCMIVHRDVKSSNILLDQNFHAKVADFGLAKIFGDDAQMSLMSTISGTPGYIDPEYQRTLLLSEKSDVYSFGVVLLEVVTGGPPVVPNQAHAHIVSSVSQKLAKGALENIVDARLQGEYDANSVWKIIDLALKCTAEDSTQRPTMAQVVTILKESLALESARAQSKNTRNEIFDASQVSVEPGSMSVSFAPSAR